LVLIFTWDEKHFWKLQKLEFVCPRIVPQIGKWRHDHFLISTMFGNIIQDQQLTLPFLSFLELMMISDLEK